jgi:hypothetical protein
MAQITEKNRDRRVPVGPALGVQFEILLTRAAKHKCRPSGRYVTLRKFHASKGDVGGYGDPEVGFSPAGKEGSW